MNFTHLMNKNTFRPTAAQMSELEAMTKAITGDVRVNALRLSDVNVAAGTAVLVVGVYQYQAFKLRSNGRWYLSGDYSY